MDNQKERDTGAHKHRTDGIKVKMQNNSYEKNSLTLAFQNIVHFNTHHSKYRWNKSK